MTALLRQNQGNIRLNPQWNEWISHLLWNIHSPKEEFIRPPKTSDFPSFFYESMDSTLHPIFYVHRNSLCNNGSIILLTGSIFHPKICLNEETPILRKLRNKGYNIYIISHRGHQRSSLSEYSDGSLDGIAREDLSSALREIKSHSNEDSFHWMGQGLGGILCLFWLAQSGWDSVESISLYNTPVCFPNSKLSYVHSFSKYIRRSISLQKLFQLKLACAKHWNLSTKERSWLFHSKTEFSLDLLNQILSWSKEGTLLSNDASIQILDAIPESPVPFAIVSTNSSLYGGHVCSYPLSLVKNSTWIEVESGMHFPLFSSGILPSHF